MIMAIRINSTNKIEALTLIQESYNIQWKWPTHQATLILQEELFTELREDCMVWYCLGIACGVASPLSVSVDNSRDSRNHRQTKSKNIIEDHKDIQWTGVSTHGIHVYHADIIRYLKFFCSRESRNDIQLVLLCGLHRRCTYVLLAPLLPQPKAPETSLASEAQQRPPRWIECPTI